MADRTKAAELAKAVAALVEKHTALDIWDACTAVLAANDVLNGSPYWTQSTGLRKIRSEVFFFSETAREFMLAYNRLPEMSDLMLARAEELKHQLSAARARQRLN